MKNKTNYNTINNLFVLNIELQRENEEFLIYFNKHSN